MNEYNHASANSEKSLPQLGDATGVSNLLTFGEGKEKLFLSILMEVFILVFSLNQEFLY